MTIIQADKFILRTWQYSDIDSILKYANNKKIADNLTDAFPYPYIRKDAESFLDKYAHLDPPIAFAIEINKEACGAISVSPQTDIHRKNAEMGYWLAEPYWGKGIITEAIKHMIAYGFRTWDIDRIFARPFSTNKASQRVLEKAGMKLEVRFEKTVIKNGVFLDELIYSIRNK
ncbi:MAG: GNAT family protein [Bacteroidales bacterium]|jgi:RimJ/RimL family protein N-acetyltransferase